MKILVADDDEISLVLLKELLEKDGHKVVSCSDGNSVIERTSHEDFDAVIIDWMMPGMSGIEVCRALRSQVSQSDTYIILLTSRAQKEDILNGLRAGANDYVIKPISYSELKTRLKAAERFAELNDVILSQRQNMVASAKMAVLGEMASGVAHEINNPLAIIISKMQQLDYQLKSKDEENIDISGTCDLVINTAYRIAKVVKALHTFTAAETDESFQEVHVQSMFEDLLSFCRAKIVRLDIKLSVDQIDDDISIMAQRGQIIQVLLNLIENSIYALKSVPRKEIYLGFSNLEDEIEIFVEDSGPIIDKAIRDKLMQPFFTTKDVGEGMGLGLSVAKGIIDHHQGKFYLDEKSERNRFVMRLPKGIRK